MFSKYLSAIDGISAYPIFSLFVFVPFFVLVTIWVFKLDKQFLNYMGEMPLDDSTESVEDRN
jgi:hypothetical protein